MSLMDNHDMDHTKRLVSAICILHCIRMPAINLLYDLNTEMYLLPLADMLSFHPDKDVVAEYAYISSQIPEKLW